jgi:SAM-dependent methyltransferase
MTRSVSPADSSADLVEIANRFAEAKCLLAADELGVFGVLHAGPATTEEICAKLGLRNQAAPDFLHALAALGVVERTGADQFANSQAANRYLAPASPDYIGSLLKHRNNSLYGAYAGLPELLTKADVDAATDGNARENFSAMLDDPARAQHMLDVMKRLTGFMGPKLAEAVDWGAYESVVDLGGANGLHVTAIAAAHPHLRAGVFDLPQLRPYALEEFARAGVADRVEFHAGNFFADDFPPADVYVLSHILHNFAPQTRYSLVAKAFRTLNPGGVLLVVDRMIDEERSVLARLIESLHLAVISDGGGSEYRPSDCEEYLRAAGFASASVHALTDAETLVTGHKDSSDRGGAMR